MRTTIILDDYLGERLRQEARRRKQSFSAFLAEAGRKALGEGDNAPPTKPFHLITYGQHGVQLGVNLEKTSERMVAEDEEAYRT